MKKHFAVILFAVFILSGSKSLSQIFVQIAGLNAESTKKEFLGAIEAKSLEWGAKNPSTASTGSARAGRVQVEELKFTKLRGAASAALQTAVFTGQIFPKVEIKLAKAAGSGLSTYLTFTLENVTVTSWSISAGDNGESPKESFSLVFSKFKTEDVPAKSDNAKAGSINAGWDIGANKAN